VGLSGIVVALLVGCGSLAVVEDHLQAGGVPATEFSSDDETVTLSARFNEELAADEPLMVEWLFPDGKIYMRKPVRRSFESRDLLETSIPIRGKAPARHPGTWQVRLWHDGGKLVDRYFDIRIPAQTPASVAERFTGLAFCGPSRWNDPVISGRRSGAVTTGRPGAWIGGEVLKAAGATYSGVILLTGCAPS
jgi:hypothetical protein